MVRLTVDVRAAIAVGDVPDPNAEKNVSGLAL